MTVPGLLCYVLFCYDKDLYAGWIELFHMVKAKLFVSRRSEKIELNSSGSTNSPVIPKPESSASLDVSN